MNTISRRPASEIASLLKCEDRKARRSDECIHFSQNDSLDSMDRLLVRERRGECRWGSNESDRNNNARAPRRLTLNDFADQVKHVAGLPRRLGRRRHVRA